MKHLWVNGDSHTAGTYSPTNVATPFAQQIANHFNLDYTNIALAGGSNQRIIRTTIEALPSLSPQDTFILIGWSSWERTEWYWDNQWHQICGDPGYNIPEYYQQRWQANADYYSQQFTDKSADQELWMRSKYQENAIFSFHHLLNNLGYKFLFFLGCANSFRWESHGATTSKLPWLPGSWAHDPYIEEGFSYACEKCGFARDHFWHYGQSAHDMYAQELIKHIKLW